MPSDYAIKIIKEHAAEPDREKRRAIVRKAYEKIGRDCDAMIATMENFGMTNCEIFRAFETEAVDGIKSMFKEE